MAYATTTINSAQPAVELMAWLDTQMQANGWQFVETWTSSTKVANVYKSPAASNSVGVDFYVATYRPSSTPPLINIMLFEDWDAVNKKARKYAPVPLMQSIRLCIPPPSRLRESCGLHANAILI